MLRDEGSHDIASSLLYAKAVKAVEETDIDHLIEDFDSRPTSLIDPPGSTAYAILLKFAKKVINIVHLGYTTLSSDSMMSSLQKITKN